MYLVHNSDDDRRTPHTYVCICMYTYICLHIYIYIHKKVAKMTPSSNVEEKKQLIIKHENENLKPRLWPSSLVVKATGLVEKKKFMFNYSLFFSSTLD